MEEMTTQEVLEGSLRQSVEMAKMMKHEACRDNNGHYDLPPFLIAGIAMKDEDGEEGIAGAVVEMDLANGTHPVDVLPKMLSDLHEEGLKKFEWLIFIVEGFAKRADTHGGKTPSDKVPLGDDYERGDLEKDFRENPASEVEEGIIGTLYAWGGQGATLTQFYKYGDDGLPMYEEQTDDMMNYHEADNPQQGRLPDVFHAFVRYCHMTEMLSNTEGDN